MAEEKDFSKVEGRDPSTWSSFGIIGDEYKKFLLLAEENDEKSKLTERQKEDLKALQKYLEQSNNSNDGMEQISYDESQFTAEDWQKLANPVKLAVEYLSYPAWALSDKNKQLKAYVENKWKTSTIISISNDARKKIGMPLIGSNDSKVAAGGGVKQQNSQEAPVQRPKKGFIFWIKRLGGKKQNQENEHSNEEVQEIKPQNLEQSEIENQEGLIVEQ